VLSAVSGGSLIKPSDYLVQTMHRALQGNAKIEVEGDARNALPCMTVAHARQRARDERR
jgi:hypothetical protein